MTPSFVRALININSDKDVPGGIESLPELIEFAADHNPNLLFALQGRTAEDEMTYDAITFSQLQRAVESASAWLVRSGATTGRSRRAEAIAPVAIFMHSHITIFMYLAALMRIGVPVLLLSADLPTTAISHLLRETRTSVVLTDTQHSRMVEEANSSSRTITNVVAPTFFGLAQAQEGGPVPALYQDYEHNDIEALILHTSGTDGLPKPIYHSQAYLLRLATCHRLSAKEALFDPNVSTLPLYHEFGLVAPCLSLSIGMPVVLLPSTSIPTVKTTLTALQTTGARHLITVPSIVEEIVRYHREDGLKSLRQLKFVAVVGAGLEESTIRDLVQANVKVLNCWGTAEIGLMTPVEIPQRNDDSRYIKLRPDMDLRLVPLEDATSNVRLTVKPPGWREHFVVQDILTPNPLDPKQFQIGRAKRDTAFHSSVNGTSASPRTGGGVQEEPRIAAMRAMVEKHERLLASFPAIPPVSHSGPARCSDTAVNVLLTGSTGNIGCSLLARLAEDPAVKKVICLNRRSSTDLLTRQKEQMRMRGVDMSAQAWRKVTHFECDLKHENLSLDADATRQLLDVTHIVHNAWPVTFSRTLSFFEPHIRGVVNLLRIASRSTYQRNGPPTRFLFISAIGSAGKYHRPGASEPFTVPECVSDPGFAIETGYAESKWVCETLVTMATKMFPSSIRGSCVRVGQVTGPEGSGVWSPKEYVPILMQMSLELGALPSLEWSFSWMPTNRVACGIVELLFSTRFLPFYNLENPSRQSCVELFQTMAAILHEVTKRPLLPLVSLSEWLTRARRLGNESNGAVSPLVTWFEKGFHFAVTRMALDTTNAREDSISVRNSGPLERWHFEQYITYWHSVGALPSAKCDGLLARL